MVEYFIGILFSLILTVGVCVYGAWRDDFDGFLYGYIGAFALIGLTGFILMSTKGEVPLAMAFLSWGLGGGLGLFTGGFMAGFFACFSDTLSAVLTGLFPVVSIIAMVTAGALKVAGVL